MSQNFDEAARSNNLLGDAIKNTWDAIAGQVSAASRAVGAALNALGEGSKDVAKQVTANLITDGIEKTLSTGVEIVKTRVEIALIAFVTGVSAAVLSVGYAAYKSVSALVGLFTGSFYKSENIDAVIAMNKEIERLQKTFNITAVQAGALNDAMRRLGVDSSSYAEQHAKVTEVLRGNKDALDQMGVAYKNANGQLLSNRDVLQNAQTVLDSYTEGWDRNQAAVALGLGSYEQITNYLKINQQELEKSKKRLDDYHLAMGPEAQKYVAEYQEAMRNFNNELKLSGDSMKRVFADQVMPAYTSLATTFNDGWPTIVAGTRHILAAFTSLGYGLKMVFDMVYDPIAGLMKAIGTGLASVAAAVAFALEGDWKNAAKTLVNGFGDALAKVEAIGRDIEKDAEKNLKAMQLAQGKFSQSSVENDKKIAAGREFRKKTAVEADEEEGYSLQELAKIKEDFYRATGNREQAWLARREQDRLEEREQVETHYSVLEQEYEGNASVIRALAQMKAAALTQIDTKYSRDSELAQLAGLERRLTHQKEADNALIAAIKARIATHELSEEEGNRQILLTQQKGTQALLEEARKRVEILSKTNPDSEEYAKAVGVMQKLEAALSETVAKQAADRDKYRKDSMDTMLTAAQNAYQADLNALQAAENNKTVSAADAVLKRLKLERDYADQVASIRAAELADASGKNDPKAYEAALKAKLDADKAYLEARKKVTDEETKQLAETTAKHSAELKAKIDAERAALEESRAFAGSWFGMWDAAYNSASKSLQGLSDAAYNLFAGLEGLPLKTVENLESLKIKAAEAAENYGKLYRQAQDAGLAAGATWGDAYRRLNMIPAEAARITAEFYRQKTAAEELAEALDKPSNATAAFVSHADQAIREMKLLDNAGLERLHSGINKIKEAMLAFTDKVRDALKSLQDEWDDLSMSKLQLEEKRYQDQRMQWQKDYDLAKQQGNDEAIRALYKQLELIEKIHKANAENLSADKNNLVSPLKRAAGGWIPGAGNSDTVPALLTPGEYVVRKGAAAYWGGGVMAAINNPFSQFGRELQGRIAGLAASLPAAPSIPKPVYATGGPVVLGQQPASVVCNFSITTTQPVDEGFIRRKIIPEIERVARLRA